MNVATRDLQITSGKKPLRHRELLYRAQWGIGLLPVLRKLGLYGLEDEKKTFYLDTKSVIKIDVIVCLQ